MASLLGKNDGSTKPTSFWNKKEGKYGAWGLFFIGVGAIIGIKALLPWIISFTTDLLHAGFLLSIVGLIGFFLTRERTRSMIWYQYKAFMIWVSNGFVKKNYLKIMRAYIASLQDKLVGIQASMSELGKQKGKLEKETEDYKAELESDFSKGKTAKLKANDTDLSQEERDEWMVEAKTLAERIGTNTKTIQNRQIMIDRLDMMLKVVRKMNGYAKTLVNRITHQVTVKEQEFKSISAAHKAFTNAWGIAYGHDDRRDLFNMSMEHITTLTGEKVGDMDMMMEDFKQVMRHQDLENAVFEEAGFKALEEWERKHSPKMNDDLAFLDTNMTVDALLANKAQTIPVTSTSTQENTSTKSKYLN